MSLLAGTRLGPYEILSPLGAGGMGEVYRARDTRLGRQVAIKILPESFARDAERLARFRREAQVLAALNHPHVGAIHGLEESGGVEALVLELVEGETLSERLVKEPLSIEEAVEIARQIAEALEAAHERGIVHRDLKPANVKITPDGQVKVLDFGLAKILAGDASSPDVSHSPTVTGVATEAGIVVGTAAYMSPEQARGKQVDKKTDIWAFGVVLYEMLTGRQAFRGETVSDTLAAILTRDPDWSALPSATPASVRRVLKHCLDRNVKTRLHDIADARMEMNETPEPFERASVTMVPAWRRAIPWTLAAVFAFTAAAALLRSSREAPRVSAPPVVRVSRPLVGVEQIDPPAISPDGAQVAFSTWDHSSRFRVYLWRMEERDPRLIGTEQGHPFFSPDGEWLGLLGEKIQKAALTGGGFVHVAKAPAEACGACWTSAGAIVVGRAHGGLVAVPASGGDWRDLTTAESPEVGHRWPQILPGDRSLLFTIAGPKGFVAAIVPLSEGEVRGAFREILSNAEAAQFVAPGHLVFWRGGTLLAVPFDLSSLAVTGPAAPAAGGADLVSHDESWLGVSNTGTLVYAPRTEVRALRRFVWVDRTGAEVPLDLPPREYVDPGISPDGQRISFAIQGAKAQQIWVFELKGGVSTRLTFEQAQSIAPVWAPDGRRIVYVTYPPTVVAYPPAVVMSRLADGSGSPVTLSSKGDLSIASIPTSWSSDGKTLAMDDPEGITLLRCEERSGEKGTCRAEKWAAKESRERSPYFSPDGRYLAYVSDESGRSEVYVQAFPGPGGKWQISTGGGIEPRWARDGKELFYRVGNALIAVPVASSSRPFGAPKKLFEAPYAHVGLESYDVGPDRRFLFMKTLEGSRELTLELVFNWSTELARLAPPEPKK